MRYRDIARTGSAVLIVSTGITTRASGGEPQCGAPIGPDLVGASVGGLSGVTYWGTIDGISAYSYSSNVCNMGDTVTLVEPLNDQHPVFTLNMYRYKDGRFEHIGMSWVKHMFGAATSNWCCPCTDPGSQQILGIGCADAYGSGQNGGQAGFNGMSGLGPRSDINPVTGAFPFPYTTQGEEGDAIYKRLQVHNDDLDPALNPGALYFASEHYIGPGDAAAGHQHNNMCYRPLSIDGFNGTGYDLSFFDSSRPGTPPLGAWKEAQPTVTLVTMDVPDDGRLILGCDCTDNGDGTWHYEYALYNLNSHRAARSFSVPVNPAATLTNVAFHDVDYHSGEVYDEGDWTLTTGPAGITWSTDDFGVNPNANALRWGTVYNFRFDADLPPGDVNTTVGLFRLGFPDLVAAAACGPVLIGDVNADGTVDVNDLLRVILEWGPCPLPPVDCPADLNDSGTVDVTDLLRVIVNWS